MEIESLYEHNTAKAKSYINSALLALHNRWLPAPGLTSTNNLESFSE